MPPRFDHAVVIVPALASAVRRFERLGFQVVMGGRTGPVHNALILFGDGTYLELTSNRFSALRPVYHALNAIGVMGRVAAKRDDMLQRFLPWIGARRGPIDWCIRVDDIRATIAELRAAGVAMVDEMPFERRRPDGQIAKWLLAGPRDLGLPFLIEDLTPVEIRVPFREHSEHPNGVIGIRRIALPKPAHQAFERTIGTVFDDASVEIVADANHHRFEGALALELHANGPAQQPDPKQTCGLSLAITTNPSQVGF